MARKVASSTARAGRRSGGPPSHRKRTPSVTSVADSVANVLTWDKSATAMAMVMAITRTAVSVSVDQQDHQRHGHERGRLSEGIREIGVADHPVGDRDHGDERRGDRAREAIAPRARDHGIEQRAGDALRRAHDEPEERDVISGQHGPGDREDVEADRVGKMNAPRAQGLREEVPARQNRLEPVRVEDRVHQQLRRMQDRQQFQIQRGCRERDGESSRLPERLPHPPLHEPGGDHHHRGDPPRERRSPIDVRRIRRGSGYQRERLHGGEQDRGPDGAAGRDPDRAEGCPEAGCCQHRAP